MDTSILAKFRVLKYIICFFVLFSNIAAAQQESETLRNYVALTTGDNYYPFVDPKALDNGWSVAIMKAVFQQMEKELNIQPNLTLQKNSQNNNKQETVNINYQNEKINITKKSFSTIWSRI